MEIRIKVKSKEDLKIFADLARRMGLTSSITDDDKADAALLVKMKENHTGNLLSEPEVNTFVSKLEKASGK